MTATLDAGRHRGSANCSKVSTALDHNSHCARHEGLPAWLTASLRPQTIPRKTTGGSEMKK